MIKRIKCWYFGHKWTSKSLKGERPGSPLTLESFADYTKMYCDRCGKVSKLNDRLIENTK